MSIQSIRPITTNLAVICMLASGFVLLAAPSGTSHATVMTAQHDAASEGNGEVCQDVDEDEAIPDAQGAAILIIWGVSFILFFVSIRSMVAFWLLALLLASVGVGPSVQEVMMNILMFVVVLGTLMWMGVREIFGGGGGDGGS